MKAVILVGGEGTRLRPLTCNTPKPMVPVLNRPFLEHTIDYLKQHGIGEAILAMGYLPGRIQEHFGDGAGLGIKLTYVVEDKPLGTAGAVKNLAAYLGREPFFVFNGDIFTDIDLTALAAFHRHSRATATIALTRVDDPTKFGVVETDSRGIVLKFVEKPKPEAVTSHMINAGIYFLEPDVLDVIPRGSHFMFEHGVFPMLLKEGRPVFSFATDTYWIDVGTPSNYLQLNHDLLLGKSQRSHIQGKERIGQGSRFDTTAHIEGNVAIGRDCRIGANARIVGPCVIGNGCRIEEGALVETSVLWDDVCVGAAARLKDCVVARGCVLKKSCSAVDGCALGDGVTLGEGSRLQGVKVWPEGNIEPGSCLVNC